jgi:hypothetical protein
MDSPKHQLYRISVLYNVPQIEKRANRRHKIRWKFPAGIQQKHNDVRINMSIFDYSTPVDITVVARRAPRHRNLSQHLLLLEFELAGEH